MNKKGISLVALVITIIVLVIITTGVIMLATGENGIIQRAQNAIEANNRAAAMEKVILEVSNIKMEIAGTGQTIAQYLYDETYGAERRDELREKGIFIPDTLPEGQELVFTVDEYVVTTDLNGKVKSTILADATPIQEDIIPYDESDTAILTLDVSESSSSTNKVYAKVYENDNGGLDLVIDGENENAVMGNNILSYMPNDTVNPNIDSDENLVEGERIYLKDYNFDTVYIKENILTLNLNFMKFNGDWYSNIKYLTIPSTVRNLDFDNNFTYGVGNIIELVVKSNVVNSGADNCSGNYLESLEFTDIETISYHLIYNCPKLKTIKLPDNLKAINEQGIFDTPKLQTVELPNNLEYFEADNFVDENFNENYDDTPFLATARTIYTNNGLFCLNNKYLIDADDTITTASVPNTISIIASYAFEDCTSLSSITIPNSVTSIGDSAFSECTSLSSITIPNSVTTISSSAFSGCTSLSSITIPNSVNQIRFGIFWGTGATSVTINYNGTQAQWQLIDKSEDWTLYNSGEYYDYFKAFSIVCTDGTITIPSRTVRK